MTAGISAGLLVFTGFWHATEWMMDGRRRDTWMLVLPGLVYLVLGCLIAISAGGAITQIIAIACVLAGAGVAYSQRNTMDVRRWVVWAFILIDIVIALGLAAALLT